MIEANVFGRLPKGVKKSRVLRSARTAVAAAKASDAAVNIIFVSQGRIRDLNRSWRKIDKPTDVLSFQSARIPTGKEKEISGEVFIAPAFIKESLRAVQGDYKEEVIRAVIHGVLHIMGYDHVKPVERRHMLRIQELALSRSLSKV